MTRHFISTTNMANPAYAAGIMGRHKCGHKHRSVRAAERCRSRRFDVGIDGCPERYGSCVLAVEDGQIEDLTWDECCDLADVFGKK